MDSMKNIKTEKNELLDEQSPQKKADKPIKTLVKREPLIHLFKLMWVNKAELHFRKRNALDYMTEIMDISVEEARDILNS